MTRCVEGRVLFHAAQCKKELPKGGGLTSRGKHTRSWLECQQTEADSWIPTDANDGVSRLYEAQASASDRNALAALLAPLSPQARATFKPGDFKRPFQVAFEGPGNLSFFVVGAGSTVIVFAVTNLDDFQFADIAADVSASMETMTTAGLDFATMAEDAGVSLGYHTELSHRAMPPPGGIVAEP